MTLVVRPARPDDYESVRAVVDEWWGRPMARMLPRLFLDHFFATSLIAEYDDALAGFLIGFHSPSVPHRAYIHFVAVAPAQRGTGLARRMYETFFEAAVQDGCTVVGAITSPGNTASVAFHRAMGFVVQQVPDYNELGVDRIVFERAL
jgi:predicted GNAT superfamily acetyltransferase